MILPIVAYGDPILRKKAEDITEDFPDLKALIEDMFETMYNAPGVGLAAPQIGRSIRLFVVDSEQLFKEDEEGEEELDEELDEEFEDDIDADDFPDEVGIKRAFINAKMVRELGTPWSYEEGCLSIPGIKESVERKDKIVIQYYDEDFNFHEEEFDGMTARIIQHEYDHIEGKLFTDYVNPLKKRMLKTKLEAISKGNVKVAYKMSFPLVKKGR